MNHDAMQQRDSEKRQIDLLQMHLEASQKKCEDLQAALIDLQQAHEIMGIRYEDMDNAMKGLLHSEAWRMTKPLRWTLQTTKKGLKACKAVYVPLKWLKDVVIKGPSAVKRDRFRHKHYGYFRTILPEQREWEEKQTFDREIKFSILVPLYNTPEKFLREMIESVQYQTYANWELCLADGSDPHHAEVGRVVDEYRQADNRIRYTKLEKNLGISDNTNACIDMSTGNFIALFDHDDILHPSVLYEMAKAICEQNADFVYTDEATFVGSSTDNIVTFHFKPDYAIDNLRANNYICHFSAFSKELLDKVGRYRHAYDGSQDHDMVLRLTDKAEKVVHIDKLLYFWRSHENSVAQNIDSKTYAIDAGKRAVHDSIATYGYECKVESSRAFQTIYHIKYQLKRTPKVSILIPNKDHLEDLKRCLSSILLNTTYPAYEIVIIENNSTKKETFEFYQWLEDNFDNIRIITYEGGFNYARINNFGARHAQGEYYLLLNNDTEVIAPDWIEELMMYGQREDVGAVGAKLYHVDGTVQHAGIILGLGAAKAAGHAFYGQLKIDLGYMGKLWYAQDVSAVTAACMLISKKVYEEVGGFDESFAVAFNDVDLCLRIRETGRLIVFNPYVELSHYESRSRGMDSKEENKARFKAEAEHFRTRWKEVLEKGDPFYNRNLSLDKSYDLPPEMVSHVRRDSGTEENKDRANWRSNG